MRIRVSGEEKNEEKSEFEVIDFASHLDFAFRLMRGLKKLLKFLKAKLDEF